MTIGVAFALAFLGTPLGGIVVVIGGLMARFGSARWQGPGWALVFVGAALTLLGGYMLFEIGQTNWGL